MRFVGSFDPAATTTGQMSIGALDPDNKVLLYNLSIVSIVLNFEDGTSDILHAWEAKWWHLENVTSAIPWKQHAVLTSQPGPISEVTITLYGADEEVTGNYPMSLLYISNLGNAIPLTTAATSIVNSGNAAGTDVITCQVLGDGNNAVVLKNDATLTLGDGLYPGTLNVDTTNCNTANVGIVNCTTENVNNVIANVHVDTPTVNCTTANVGTINTTTANVGTITVNTILNLLQGSVTRVGRATGTGTQTITHNWGHQANVVIPYYNGAFGVAPTDALFVFNEGANSFQVTGQGTYSWTVFFLAF